MNLNLQMGNGGGNRLPRTGLIWTGPVDTIGLSANALWAALPAEHRSIYFSDPEDDETMLDVETIITNIEASEYLNDGGELVGNEQNKAQYEDGTDEAILRRAYRWAGVAYPELPDSFAALTEEQFNALTEEQLNALGA